MLKVIPSVLFILGSIASIAQRDVDERSPLKERIYFGGGLGFGTGTGYTQFSLNPLVGYMVNPQFSTGLVINYQNYIYTYYNPSVSIQQYGISPFARYRLSKELFLYGEFDIINAPNYNGLGGSGDRAIYNRLPVGLGYVFSSGNGRGALNAIGLYDLIYKNNNSGIFQSPWVFRVFFTY